MVIQYIQNESFLDSLFHGVAVERTVLDLIAFHVRLTENLQSLVLRGSGECEVTGIGEHLSRFHDTIDPILCRFIVLFTTIL